LYQEVLKKSAKTPIPTFFTDSTQLIAPFMSSAKTKDGYDLGKGLTFLGRSGVKIVSGLRIAYISGVDFDVLGAQDV
jgi:hypothetical protein